MEKETLYKYFSGKASETEKEAIRSWMEEDADNEKTLYNERSFYDAIMLADEADFAEQKKPFIYQIKNWALQSVKWAAVLAIAFLSSYLFFTWNADKEMLANNTISVPYGERVNLSLSDGTKVCLNSGTTFTYPSSFGKETRDVELNGEAFFEVSANKEKPFIVHTHACNVKVLGTKFNVNAYKSEHSFSTALMQGKVRIQNNSNPANVVDITPHYQATLSDGKLAVAEIKDYNIYRWREGLFCFEDLNLKTLMDTAEKYYGIEIIINNPDIVSRSFSGKFRISDGIDNLLRVLQRDVHFQYNRSEDESVIYIN